MSFVPEFVAGRKAVRFRLANALVVTSAFIAGIGVFVALQAPRTSLVLLAGVAALAALLLFPELALALFVVIGDLKGDDRVAAILPWDLTLALAAVLIAGIALNFFRGKPVARPPGVYLLFVPFVAVMTASLAYTPVFDAGLEKLGRFIGITGISILAPFFVLGTPCSLKRFFVGFSVAGFAICAWSLSALDGSARLATPSNNTIALGHIACALILILWFGAIPRVSFPQRFAACFLLAVPAVALIGSGSRGPLIACAVVVLASVLVDRRRWLDLGCLAALALAAVPFLKLPASSLDYLGTLVRSRTTAELLSFRGDLIDSAWRLLQQHPLIGGGIQSFRYFSPNSALYNWPHNIFLEIACELGIPAALLVCAVFGTAIRESLRQIRYRTAPHFAFSEITAALLAVGIINGTNTGDINSDRLTWLFVSLVFVARAIRTPDRQRVSSPVYAQQPAETS